MTFERIKEIIKFDSKLEEDSFNFYIKMKGIAIHENIIKYLGYDLSSKYTKVTWSKVSVHLRYDKKLRDTIYIYLATLEEYIRAFIGNKYEDDIENFNLCQTSDTKMISNRIDKGEKISKILQSISFGSLIKLVKNMNSKDINEMFNNVINLSQNLDAVVVLRNAVSHHVFLLDNSFKECYVNDVCSNSLENNIKNLRQLLPEEYRYGINGKGGITSDIEKCKFEIINNKNVLLDINTNNIINMN